MRREVEELTVPIRAILEAEYGPVFEPEDVPAIVAAFEASLNKLRLSTVQIP